MYKWRCKDNSDICGLISKSLQSVTPICSFTFVLNVFSISFIFLLFESIHWVSFIIWPCIKFRNGPVSFSLNNFPQYNDENNVSLEIGPDKNCEDQEVKSQQRNVEIWCDDWPWPILAKRDTLPFFLLFHYDHKTDCNMLPWLPLFIYRGYKNDLNLSKTKTKRNFFYFKHWYHFCLKTNILCPPLYLSIWSSKVIKCLIASLYLILHVYDLQALCDWHFTTQLLCYCHWLDIFTLSTLAGMMDISSNCRQVISICIVDKSE